MTDLHRPETDESVLREYRISEPSERARLLTTLVNTGDRVSIYVSHDAESGLESRLLSYDAARNSLEFEILQTQTHRTNFGPGSRAVAVAVMAQVKLQFDIDPLSVDIETRKFQVTAPSSIVRLQRRGAFRVLPPREAGAQIFVREAVAGSREWRTPVLDLSVTGLSFQWSRSRPPKRGEILQSCRLELAGVPAITCQLLVVNTLMEGPPDSRIARVGVEFIDIDSSAARAIQVYVNAAQTRSRARRPALS